MMRGVLGIVRFLHILWICVHSLCQLGQVAAPPDQSLCRSMTINVHTLTLPTDTIGNFELNATLIMPKQAYFRTACYGYSPPAESQEVRRGEGAPSLIVIRPFTHQRTLSQS
jgi:hypothetical protein